MGLDYCTSIIIYKGKASGRKWPYIKLKSEVDSTGVFWVVCGIVENS